MLKSRQGQSTVEYIVVVTAVIVIGFTVIMGTFTHDPSTNEIVSASYSSFQNKINESYTSGSDAMTDASSSLFSSMSNSRSVPAN